MDGSSRNYAITSEIAILAASAVAAIGKISCNSDDDVGSRNVVVILSPAKKAIFHMEIVAATASVHMVAEVAAASVSLSVFLLH